MPSYEAGIELVARVHATLPGEPPAKRARTHSGNADLANEAQELAAVLSKESVLLPSKELAQVLRTVVHIMRVPATEWASRCDGSAATYDAGASAPLDAAAIARQLLFSAMPAPGALSHEVSLQLIGRQMTKLGSLRTAAFKWLVLAHESIDEWDGLMRARSALLFHLRDAALTQDCAYMLWRLCQSVTDGPSAGWEHPRHTPLLSEWQLSRVVAHARSMSHPPASLRALLHHQVRAPR